MSAIVEIYTEAVRENLKPLFANWEPGKPVELGDYGTLAGEAFIHIGNIKDLGMGFDVREDDTPDRKYFSSEGSTEIKLNMKGAATLSGAINAKATLEINFGSKEAVFFNAAECRFSMIRDKAAVGKEIMKRCKAHDWDRDWALVTDLVRSGATTIAISGADHASVIFEASGNVDKINLSDASVGLNVANQKNVGYIVDAQKGLIPLIGLSKIQPTFLWFGDTYKPLCAAYSPRMLSVMRNSPHIQTEESPEDLYFGQLK
ncbi:MAG: hypothetical protein WA081_09405 [Desulfosalsimonadaceae bacterium]